jgi:hypothetical protein
VHLLVRRATREFLPARAGASRSGSNVISIQQRDAPTADRRRATRSPWALVGASAFVVLILLGLPAAFSHSGPAATFSPTGAAPAHSPGTATLAAPAHLAPAAKAPAVPKPSAGVFNPPCYKIDIGVCVSICTQNESDVIPNVGSFVSSVQPNSSADIQLCIKSQTQLDWPYAAHSGQKSPFLLNVTGVLWNGDPYYSPFDGDYWHSDNPSTVWSGPTKVPTNQSGYVWWYMVTISAKSSSGAPNFYPGETVTWWIELTYNESGSFIHRESPHFQFTFSGAWPYSPYPGAAQYAGASATFEDVNVTVSPRTPNWNDSVSVVINTTQADALTNATIGSAYIDLTETSQTGALLRTGTIAFPVQLAANTGATSTAITIPASYDQTVNATISYTLTILDTAQDQLVTPVASYIVGGNGSFLSGICIDDLNLQTNPPSVLAEPLGQAMLNPGQVLNISVTSRNLGTAISASEVIEQVSYPLLHEIVTIHRPLSRVSSTDFEGSLSGLPLGSFVNFTIFAWDFNQRLESCPIFGYYTPSFATYVPLVQVNSTFFYIFVYDNGTKEWVTGAHVQITGPRNFFNSVSNTTFGAAYPNETRNQYIPLLLPANNSYVVTVSAPGFTPSGQTSNGPVNATIRGLHLMTNRQTLVLGGNYEVVQEASTVIFYLNTTPPTTPASPAVPGGQLPIAGVIGIAAAGATAVPLALWWRSIRAKRKEEEKRVTL